MAVEVAISALGVLIKQLAPELKEEVCLIRRVEEELKNLLNKLSLIQSILADAEDRQIMEKAVEEWLVQLKNVAYDAEDVLDEFAYEDLRRELMEHDETKKVCNFSISCCLLRPIRLMHDALDEFAYRRNQAHKIKQIKENVDRIYQDGERFHLKKGDGENRRNPGIVPRPPSSSVIAKNSDFVGRDDDIKKILNMLLSDEDASYGTEEVSVISIVGMGGLGKTTLAQLVYNNENVQKHFRVKAWVCVSEVFDISRLTREIIESATGESCNSSSFDSMQSQLRKILSAERFLIVLDDVWNTERSEWDGLQTPFRHGPKGSKIIVTTRDEAVSTTMGTDHVYRLELLSHDYCLSLFLRHAFVREDRNAYPELKEIGRKLVESHCHGLPLAAKVLGCLLSSKRVTHFWGSILNSQLWSSNEGGNEVMKALRISYHHLPPHIKQCFAFCSIFPKDYLFEKDVLVKLWMAQGFIQPTDGFTLEAIGSGYFDFLLSRSFFQEEHRTNWRQLIEVYYKMHDCIHDLAMLVSSDECFRFGRKPDRILASRYRHASMGCDKDIVNLKDLYDCKGIRTVIIWSPASSSLPASSSESDSEDRQQQQDSIYNQINDLFVKLRYLRVLVLKDLRITELPDSISNLKHLRYLDLTFTDICQLPESVSSLYNLQTLALKECIDLHQLPEETRKLVNLRHLNLKDCWSLQSMPQEMGSLTNLQTLGLFVVGRDEGCGIKELEGLTALKGNLEIKNLHNVLNAKEAEEANLKDKKDIESLELEFGYDEKANTNVQNEESRKILEHSRKILEALQPHTNLKSLSISKYGGKDFPSWFQSLTSLEELYITDCPQLSLPEGLPTSLKCLWISDCLELDKRCRHQDGEDWRKISHIPTRKVDGQVYFPPAQASPSF